MYAVRLPYFTCDYFSKVLPSGRRRPLSRDTKQPREAYTLPQTADSKIGEISLTYPPMPRGPWGYSFKTLHVTDAR